MSSTLITLVNMSPNSFSMLPTVCYLLHKVTGDLTEPLSCLVVIDMDGRIYARPWQGGLLSGGFEKNPKPIFTEGRNQLEIQNMQEDWDHFGNGGRERG